MDELREWLVEKRTEEAVQKVYELSFADDLSAIESRLVWVNVISKLVQSIVIDRQSEAMNEWLGLKPLNVKGGEDG